MINYAYGIIKVKYLESLLTILLSVYCFSFIMITIITFILSYLILSYIWYILVYYIHYVYIGI